MDEEDDVAKTLTAALADEGEHVDDGTFTLDAAGAYRKLREHQLANPHGYVLLLVEAAWLAADPLDQGVIRIVPGQTTTISFSGVALEPDSLGELFQAALGRFNQLEGEALRRARILQLLGLAANNALALGPKQIHPTLRGRSALLRSGIIIEASNAKGDCHRVSIDPSGALTLEPVGSRQPCRVRFVFSGPLLDVFGGRMTAERQLLERCRHTRLAVFVDDELVSQKADIDGEGGIAVPVMLDGRKIGLVRSRDGSRATWIVNRGVAISDPPTRQSRMQAIVEVDLPMDLSRAQLLQGPELEAVRQAIREAQAQVGQSWYNRSDE
jgi:hypothetical protein